jgi:hypothetical protein
MENLERHAQNKPVVAIEEDGECIVVPGSEMRDQFRVSQLTQLLEGKPARFLRSPVDKIHKGVLRRSS